MPWKNFTQVVKYASKKNTHTIYDDTTFLPFPGVIGNTLVILVVSTNHQMRNTTNALILNLALADLLFIIFCVPFTATDYSLDRWPFGLVWCQVD